MCNSTRSHHRVRAAQWAGAGAQRDPGRPRQAFTLVELIVSTGITSLLAVVLGGLVLAVQAAREHTEGLQEATAQAQAALDRIELMVSEAGVYELPGRPSRVGLAVVSHRWGTHQLPLTLVVWSGGPSGGMAAKGALDRLPRVDELVIYTPDPADPSRLVEVTVPGDSRSIDFDAADFDDTILSLLEDTRARRTLLCDRMTSSRLDGFSAFPGNRAAHLRFALRHAPSDDALAGTTPGSSAWYGLSWAQGVVSSESGLRQSTVRMELQVRLRGESSSTVGAVPYFGCGVRSHAYQP